MQAPQEMAMHMSASAITKGSAEKPPERLTGPRTVVDGMTAQLQKPVKPPPPQKPQSVKKEKRTDDESAKPRPKPTPPEPPGYGERFSGPLGVEMSSGPPPIVSVVLPEMSVHLAPHPEMSEESMKWLDLKKEVGDIVTAVEKSVEAAASSTEGLVKAEEELGKLAEAEIVNRGQRPLLASEMSDELIRPKSQDGGSNEMEDDGPVNFPAPLFAAFAPPVSPGSPDLSEFTLNGTLQSLRSIEGEEQGSFVHIEQEVKDESDTVVNTPITM